MAYNKSVKVLIKKFEKGSKDEEEKKSKDTEISKSSVKVLIDIFEKGKGIEKFINCMENEVPILFEEIKKLLTDELINKNVNKDKHKLLFIKLSEEILEKIKNDRKMKAKIEVIDKCIYEINKNEEFKKKVPILQ